MSTGAPHPATHRGRAHGLRIAAGALLVVLLMSPMAPRASTTGAAADPPAVLRSANAQALAADLRLVNYYPRDRAWEQQWLRFSADVTAGDFSAARGLGATSVRVVVFPSVVGFPRPSAAELAKLRTTIELADAAGLRVWLTLFDNFGSYGDLSGSRTWTAGVLGPYADDPRIEAVEIRNEIKQTPATMTWARDQITAIHELSPTVPVAVSLNGSVEPEAYGTLLDALVPVAPDLVSYHYYGEPVLAFSRLRRATEVVRGIPLVVGEAGLSTAALERRCPDADCREAEQLDWFQVVVAAAHQAGLSTPAPWTLLDLTTDATTRTVTPAGYGYGLLRVDGSRKPAADVLTEAWAGRWTTAPQNTDFGATTMDAQRARGWVPWRPSGSFRVEAGAGVDGSPALAVSGTKSWTDSSSAWYARPLTAVRPGQTWRARVSARGVRATGRTTISLVWLDPDGAYLRQSVSGALDLRSTAWQTLSVTTTVPPGAAAVRVHLSSNANEGTVWFSNPTWDVEG